MKSPGLGSRDTVIAGGAAQPRSSAPRGGAPIRLVNGPPEDWFESRFAAVQAGAAGRSKVPSVFGFLTRLLFMAAVVAYGLLVAGVGWQMTKADHAVAVEPAVGGPALTSPLKVASGTTGVTTVDNSLRGFLNGDLEEAVSQLVAWPVACGTLPWGGSPVLACAATEALGTPHAMILAGCVPEWKTSAAARDELGDLLVDRPGAHRVTQVSGGYRATLGWPGRDGRLVVLAISQEGVTSYRSGCEPLIEANPGRDLAPLGAVRR